MANLPGMGLGPGTIAPFGTSDRLVVRNGHGVIALGVVKRVTKLADPCSLVVMDALLEGLDHVFTHELSSFEILIIVQRDLNCDQFLQVLEGLVRFKPGNRFGRIGIGTRHLRTLLNEHLDGFVNLMQAGFGQWNSTAIWFEHRLHAWIPHGRTGWNYRSLVPVI